MQIVNGREIVIVPTRQRNLPLVADRVPAIAERAVPRVPHWRDQPDASSHRGRLIDLLV